MELDAFSETPVILVGDGYVHEPAFAKLPGYPVIGVDGGAAAARRLGREPALICGDFDSVNPADFAEVPQYPTPDQDHTDFAKALDLIPAPVVHGFGFLGSRLDHSLASLAEISCHQTRRITLYGESETIFIWPPDGGMEIEPGRRIAFWSAGQTQVAHSHGLRWPLDGMMITPMSPSISNEASAGGIQIAYAGDPLIAILALADH